jgi:predicted MFS family arabinose efflux permease
VGLVMTGLITGILLARTVAGAVGSAYGWRVVFGGAAAAMLVLAASVASFLPRAPSGERVRYVDVLRSIPPLVVRYPLLREAALAGGMAFAAFSAFWTALTFHLSAPPWNYGPGTIGAFGLVGVAGALAASAAGRLADRTGPRRVVGYGLATLAASFVLMFAFRTSLAGLIVGIVLLDLGVQGTHISNQARVYSLPAELHSRLNTVYMVSYFVGGALGSLLGAAAWTHFGWPGVCALGAGMAGVALAVHLIGGRTGER